MENSLKILYPDCFESRLEKEPTFKFISILGNASYNKAVAGTMEDKRRATSFLITSMVLAVKKKLGDDYFFTFLRKDGTILLENQEVCGYILEISAWKKED